MLPESGRRRAFATVRSLADLARAAEESGWDGVFLEDYLVYHSEPRMPTVDVWMALTAMALATTQIRIGTAVTPIPRQSPVRLARQLLTLDHASGGRAILGAGLGDLKDPSWRPVLDDEDIAKRAEMTDEGLSIVAALCSGDEVDVTGRHFQVHGLALWPLPIQRPRPPIWIGGLATRRGVVRRAARWEGALVGWKSTSGSWQQAELLGADDLRTFRSAVESIRGQLPFDYVVGGARPQADRQAELDYVASMEAAGATWWMLWVPPCEPGEARRIIIERRPPLPGF